MINRRQLLRTSGGLAALSGLAALPGCSFFSTDAVDRGGDDSGGSLAADKEAPSLAAKVEAGDLPELAKRLPKQPMIVEPLDRIGQYGGTWNTAMVTQDDATWLSQAIAYEPLVRWTTEWTDSPGTEEILPNYCESFKELEGGSIFEFKLREGMRWSDGEPVTAEDYRFTYEDYNVYDELHPYGIYALWTNPVDEKPGKFEIVDDLTIRYVFNAPKPGFLNEQALNRVMVLPKHYLAEFHKLHNPDVEKLVKKEKLNDWLQLLENKLTPWTNPDLPTLNAWSLVKPLGEGSAVTAERNPYYWKTDPDGRQLPYIDKINCEVLLDTEVEVLKVVNGELDMQLRNFGTVRNKPVIARNQEKGNYRLIEVGPTGVNALVIGFNQTFGDKQLSKLHRNKDFRVGLSHAINRQKIIDTVYAGQGKPWQCAPLEGHPAFDEEFGTQFTAYDKDEANSRLDAAGLSKKDPDGIRLFQGKKLVVTLLTNAGMPDHVDALEMVKADWKVVGVDVQVQRVAETLYWERVAANQSPCSAWTGGNFDIRATQGSNHYYVPSNPERASIWGSSWVNWYRSKGTDGETPPPPVKKSLELFDELRATYDADGAIEVAKDILAIAKEQFVYIGICTPPPTFGVVSNAMINVPESFPGSGNYMAPGPSNTEQYFFDEG